MTSLVKSGQPTTSGRQATRRTVLVVGALVLLAAACVVSMLVGSGTVPNDRVWSLLRHDDGTFDAVVVRQMRLPRTVLAVAVGLALGLAGALMQSLTRNPLADPGILGVNAGASLAVVLAVAVTGVTGIWFYLWFAFAGAAAAAVAVYVLGSLGRSAATPVRLALAGVAVSAAVGALVQTIILADQNTFNEFRFWAAGSLENRGFPVLLAVSGFIGVAALLTLALAPALNALALGDDVARGVGVNVRRTRTLSMVAITVLAGAATAAIGPVSFVGLAVPHIVRSLTGPDQRWILPVSAVAAPALLLSADVLGRVIIPGSEIQVGIITALLGGPVFILLARRPRIGAL